MTDSYDDLEMRNPGEREAALLQALPKQIAHAQQHTPAFAEILKGVNPAAITSRESLAALPVTRKYELLERQQAQRANDVFGGFSALSFGKNMPRVFASTFNSTDIRIHCEPSLLYASFFSFMLLSFT